MQEVSRTQRPPVWPVVVAFCTAMVLVPVATVVLVLSVGVARAGGQLSRIEPEATRFALSPSGIMSAASLTAATLLLVAYVTARLTGSRDLAALSSRLRLGRSRASARGMAAALVGMTGLSLAAGTASQLVRRLLHVGTEGVMEQIAHGLSSLPPARLALAGGATR